MNRLGYVFLCPMDLSGLHGLVEWAIAIARARNAALRAFHVAVIGRLLSSSVDVD